MRRALFTIAVFLLAGAVVNVAVAWGCAYFVFQMPIGAQVGVLSGPRAVDCLMQRYDRVGCTRILVQITAVRVRQLPINDLPRWAYTARPTDDEWNIFPHLAWIVDGRGWPARSMGCRIDLAPGWLGPPRALLADGRVLRGLSQSNEQTASPPITGIRHGVLLDSTTPTGVLDVMVARTLPLAPLWPGFAVNTLFYAAILWLLIPGPFVLRRLIRRRRGLCPACAYPMGESSTCTECGRALPGRAETAT